MNSPTDRYADAASLDFGQVAPTGRRLRKRVPKIVWLVLGFIGLSFLIIAGGFVIAIGQVFLH